MSEIALNGQACDRACFYCYENPMRDAGNTGNNGYDFEAIRGAVLAGPEGQQISLFGGEPLLAPLERIEELLRFGCEITALTYDDDGNKLPQTGVQTGGALITDDHIALFKRYNTSLGVSLDGPGEMSDLRWKGTLEKTRAATSATEENIAKLLRAGIGVGLIIALHKGNTGEHLPRLKSWILEQVRMGVRSCRLHLLEVNSALMRQHVPTPEEYLAALLDLTRFEESESDLGRGFFDTARDMRQMLLRGSDEGVTCVYRGCDPYNTPAVHGVAPDGDLRNCGMANGSTTGIDWQKADTHGYDRSIVLYNTPQEYGGCQGCRFFLFCRGHCPGSAIDHDWRNRSEFCEVWKGMYTYVELKLLGEGNHPLSLAPDLAEWEQQFMEGLARGEGRLNYYGDDTPGL